MKKIFCILALSAALAANGEAQWNGLDAANWCSGPKLTAGKLRGKVVLVEEWGVFCPPCRASLPHMEQLWKKYRSKPFVIIGSHRQGNERAKIADLVKANNLSYSIYLGAGMQGEPSGGGGIPFVYLVDASGKVVYSQLGFRHDALEDAIKKALTRVGSGQESLTGGVELHHFKSLERQLVPGKSVESALAKLKAAAGKTGPKAEEAQKLVDAIEECRDQMTHDIRENVETRPGLSLIKLELLVKTWPSEKAKYAKALTKLSSSPDVKAAAKLRHAISGLQDEGDAINPAARKKLADRRKAAAAGARPYLESEFPGVKEEIAELLQELEGE